MGGKGSGGYNRKTLEEHVLSGTYRADRHGPLSKRLSRLLVSKSLSAKQSKHGKAVKGRKTHGTGSGYIKQGSVFTGGGHVTHSVTSTKKEVNRPAEVVNGGYQQSGSVPAGGLKGNNGYQCGGAAQGSRDHGAATAGMAGAGGVPVQQVSLLPYPEIGFDEIAKREWDRVCNMLIERGTINEVNRATLEGYCSAYSKAKRADQALVDGFEEEVPVVVGRGATQTTINIKKKKIENSIAEKAWSQVKMFAVLLGISSVAGDEPAPVKEEALSPMERAIRDAETRR